MSFATFWAIKKTIGLRVSDEQEDAGLDIVEHGMYGYPEQFIPESEIGAGHLDARAGARPQPVTATVRAGEATA